jgi:hypothetical protein
MKKPASHRAFTRLELLASLVVGGLLILAVYTWSKKDEARLISRQTKMVASTAKGIYNMLSAWAQDNNGAFPTAQQYSNEAFRELFKAKLFDDEKAFHIPRDPWLRKADTPGGRGPDNEIGSEPDFTSALQAGECSYAYVSGLTNQSDPQLPLLANGFTESLGVYTDDPSRKGGVFKGLRACWVSVGGSAQVSDLSQGFRVMVKRGGKLVDVFSAEWGTNPDQIKNPQGE